MDRADKVKWMVSTEYGTFSTLATSKSRAIRNVKYRIAMADMGYTRPTPHDLAVMRDLTVFSCTCTKEA